MQTALPDDLIGHLYDAAVDASAWTGTASRIAAAFDSTSTIVKLHGGDAPFALCDSTENLLVPDRLQSWAEDWHQRDLWVERSVAHGMNRVVTDDMLVTPTEQQRSGYYREWLAYLDIHHMVGAVFPAGGGAVGVLGIHRPASGGAYAEAERHKVTLLLPHLQRALRLGRRLADADLARAAALDALDRIDTGVIAVDRSGRIVHASTLAEATIRENPQLGITRGRLCLRAPAQQQRYTAMLLGCVATAEGRPHPPEPTALVIGRENRLPLTLAVTPLRPGWTDRGPAPALALVFLRDPEWPSLHLDRLRDLFGLTATEAAIAADLGAGKAPEEIARRHHIGIGTVRWHLKSVLAKTGTTRQAEAVALLARSVAALPARS